METVGHIGIKGELDIFTAGAQRQLLLDAIDAGSEVEVDLSEVSEMDSAGLQLLLAAKKTAQQGGYPLHLVMHSHAVLDALELCQLATFFGDPTLIPHPDHA